jgi:hypothetical protein
MPGLRSFSYLIQLYQIINEAHKVRIESNRTHRIHAREIMTLAAVGGLGLGLGVYVDTIKHIKKARIGPIKLNAPAMRTVRSSLRGCANGAARAKVDRESARMVLVNSIVFAIGGVEVGD